MLIQASRRLHIAEECTTETWQHGQSFYSPTMDSSIGAGPWKPYTSKTPPILPRGKTVWGVVKRVQVVKTREGVVKTKLEVVF